MYVLSGVLLNTGMERNGTEHTGINRNMVERGRITPEWNEQEWYRNIPEQAGMTPEWGGMTPK